MNKVNPFTNPGNVMAPVYERVYDETLKSNVIKKVNEFNIVEFIDASELQTDLAMLRQEMVASGNLPSVSDDVADYTNMPENIHDLYGVVNQVDQRFNALPDSIKKVFGNNKDKFLASLVSGTYEQEVVDYYEKSAKAAAQARSPEPAAGTDKEGDK